MAEPRDESGVSTATPRPASPASSPRECEEESPRDHVIASAIRIAVGLLTTVAGFVGAIAACIAFATHAELPLGLEKTLQEPMLARFGVLGLSIAAAVGGTLLLRHVAAGAPLTSGTWCVVAAIASRPGVRFNYAEPTELPLVTFPTAGRSLSTIVVFAAAVALALLTHTYCRTSRKQISKLYSTVGENLVGASFLVAGIVAAVTFRIDASTVGRAAYERALVPMLASTIALETIGFGVLAGWAIARALAIAVFVATAAGALLPDLFLDRLVVEPPLLWAPVCVAAALALLLPRMHEPSEQHSR